MHPPSEQRLYSVVRRGTESTRYWRDEWANLYMQPSSTGDPCRTENTGRTQASSPSSQAPVNANQQQELATLLRVQRAIVDS